MRYGGDEKLSNRPPMKRRMLGGVVGSVEEVIGWRGVYSKRLRVGFLM